MMRSTDARCRLGVEPVLCEACAAMHPSARALPPEQSLETVRDFATLIATITGLLAGSGTSFLNDVSFPIMTRVR